MIRWISNSRVSLQRLGFCKLAVVPSSIFSSRSELADTVRPFVQKHITIPSNSELIQWVDSIPKEKGRVVKEGQKEIARQYYWILHQKARTGWLSNGAFGEYFEGIGLPFILKLLDDECHKTELGELLLLLQDVNEISSKWEPPLNPITLSKGDKALFLFCILKEDGDFLIPLMHTLVVNFKTQGFSYLEAGNFLPNVIEEVLKRFISSVYTSDDREQYRTLGAARSKIIQNIKEKIEGIGFGSRREQTIVPRLEWLADIGILKREENKKYRYFIPRRGQEFIEKLYSCYIEAANKGYVDKALDTVLDTRLFQLLACLLCELVKDMKSVNDIIQFIAPSYSEYKSVTGYCLVRPLLLLAHIRRWDAGEQCVLEYNQAVKALEKAYQEDPEHFYFTTARFGGDVQVKLD